ncbi:DUF1573 domain-containing protein [Moheibacter lacus]|uniref:DUF1573 domain-containing protein n=1 Tax=Moheibacter lacus TaxID=2745851 RepID=A0A838ZTX1_9FLAO|nr:DUF1573 domain-containing protein [Moheibacter lacus]MBA5630427.1 DUF1573 domain-containing protein [Moheibacter lacus]
MKKIFLATAFFIGGIALMNAQEIEISESNVDLGNIKYGGKAVSTVQIKNTGDKPLIISDAKASCGCTVPKWPKDPIAPGKSAPMTVEYTTTSKAGAFNKTVTISSNAVTEGRKIFRIKGVVEANPNAPTTAATGAKK